MNGVTGRWRTMAGAVVALFAVGMSAGTVQAAERELEDAGSAVGLDNDAYYASLDLEVSEESEALPLAQRYAPAPPPPRGYRTYRPYRPHWGYRIVPPPIFAPGWFGLYFLGYPPAPPPAPAAPPPERVARPDFRHVNEYSLGVTVGAYTGQYGQGQRYADPGIRFNLDYRKSPVLGADLSVGIFGSNMRLDGQGTTARNDVPIQLSAVLHAFPRLPIQPYFLFGGTGNIRTYEYLNSDGTLGDPYTELRVGPHAGAGIELLVADRASFVVEARTVWYTLIDRAVADQTFQHDRSITGGVNFYF